MMTIQINKKTFIVYLFLLILILWYNYWYKSFISSMFFYTVTFLPILSYSITHNLFKQVKVTQATKEAMIKKGEVLHYRVQFHTGIGKFKQTFNIFTPIQLVFNYSSDLQKGFFNQSSIILQASKENILTYELFFKHRGIYEIGLKEIMTKDFFQLFNFIMPLDQFSELRIHPDLRALDYFPLPMNKNENFETDLSHKNDLYEGIKEYEHGDRLTSINWKVSAKYQDLYSKDYERVGRSKTVCLMDTRLIHDQKEKAIVYEEWYVEQTLGAFHHFLANSRSFDCLYKDGIVKHFSVSNQDEFLDFYQDYSFVQFSEDISYVDLINKYFEVYEYTINLGHLILFTSTLDRRLYEQVYDLRKKDIVVEVCHLKSKFLTKEELLEEERISKEINGLDITIFELEEDHE